jgi:hypothetical protein
MAKARFIREGGIPMRYRILLIVVGTILAAWLASCAKTASSDTLVEYSRMGGIAGLEDHLVVRASGQATLTRRDQRYEFALERETLSQLQALLDNAQFTRLSGEYLSSRPGADLFTYAITYRGHTVRSMDTAVPEVLQPALDLLNQTVASHGKP